jgi:aminoglycoside 3-N-acetyltransferase
MNRLDRAQFRRWFERLLEPTDEVVVVYSGIWTFGHQLDLPIRDVPRMLIEGMLEALGSERTLLLPSYTYAYARTRSYAPAESVPETGVLPQAMWREFPCVRTRSALNSFLAIGPKAGTLAQVVGATLWGEGSLKCTFERTHARMVTLGIPWKDSLGFLHRIEEAGRVPYRYHKTFHGQWVEGGQTRPWAETMYVRSIEVMPVFVWSRVDELLRARGRVRKAPGPVFIESADAADIVAAGLEIIADDPYAMLENADQVREWVRHGKAAEIEALRAREPAALEYHDRMARRAS